MMTSVGACVGRGLVGEGGINEWGCRKSDEGMRMVK